MNNKSIFEMPKILSDGRLDTILDILDTIKQKQDVELSFERTESISIAGHGILTMIFEIACEQRINLNFTNINQENLQINQEIINKTKLEKPLEGFVNIKNLSINKTNQILYGKVSSIAPEFIQNLELKFKNKLSEDVLWEVTLIFNELMQNAVDHSTAERYFLYAGLNKGKFEFGVLDMGVSIPAKLETKYTFESDEEFLKNSLIRGVGTRRNRAGGMGLYYLSENVKDSKGRLVILSRDAQLRLNFGTRNYNYTKLKKTLIGTWCMASIPLEDK